MEGPAPLLQLPHMDAEVLRKLTRKKLRSLPELQQADPLERHESLLLAGLTPGQVRKLASSFTVEQFSGAWRAILTRLPRLLTGLSIA